MQIEGEVQGGGGGQPHSERGGRERDDRQTYKKQNGEWEGE